MRTILLLVILTTLNIRIDTLIKLPIIQLSTLIYNALINRKIPLFFSSRMLQLELYNLSANLLKKSDFLEFFRIYYIFIKKFIR